MLSQRWLKMTTKKSTTSQRATVAERKAVFRSAIDNPYKISWPTVPLNVQNLVLASLVELLSELRNYYEQRKETSRKRKREKHDRKRKDKASATKRRKTENGENSYAEMEEADKEEEEKKQAVNDDNDTQTRMEVDRSKLPELPEAPPIAGHLTIGINFVTKRLEEQARSLRVKISVSASSDEFAASPTSVRPPITHVFVCRSDIDPPIIISHFPELIAACNKPTSLQKAPVYLVPLPKRSESTLAAIIGLPRVSIIAMDGETPGLESITRHLSEIQAPVAPWLTLASEKLAYEPTHIKQLRTTAPKDMHLAKKTRAEGRKAAKERKQERKNVEANSKDVTRNANETNRKRKQKRRIRIFATDCENSTAVGQNQPGDYQPPLTANS